MLIFLASMLLAPVPIEEPNADIFAQCAYVAAIRAQADDESDADKKDWASKASKYIDKASALAYPGKQPTDADYAALGERAKLLLKDLLKGLDEEQSATVLAALLYVCDD